MAMSVVATVFERAHPDLAQRQKVELNAVSSVPRNLRLGRYLLQERLAHGGMGEVYRASAYGAAGVVKTVCVKRILAEKADKYWRVESFIEEARLSMQLNHTNTVPVFDFGVADGGYYLAMEWIDGVDLMAFVRRGVKVPTSLVAYVGAETCRALDRAHTGLVDGVHGIVHRDVKPSNILLSRSGEVKLADFGIATLQGGQRSVAGTPGYMSPEQRNGSVVDARADIYGLGVSLLEFALGKRAKWDVPAALELVEDDDLREILTWMAMPELELRAFDAHQIGQEFERMVGRSLAADHDHPRDILSTYVDTLARLQVTRPVDKELAGTASLLFGVDDEGNVRPQVTERIGDAGAAVDSSALDGSSEEAGRFTPILHRARAGSRGRAMPSRWGVRLLLGVLSLAALLVAALFLAYPSPRSSEGVGKLDVSVRPSATVYVDGVHRGESPVLGLEVSAGEHDVRFENAELGVSRTTRVRVPEGETQSIRADLP
jgi:tRNA A-37 threonylcarbamoyl transferase component Bud32